MMVDNLLRRYNIPKRIWEAKRWYKELDQPEKWLFWMCIGGYFGVFYGTHKRHERENNMVSQHMVVTRYNVAPDDIKHFERYWNDSARLNQRQHGYEYTKLYKAISMEKSPFQYFSVRMWARSEDEEHFLIYDPTLRELRKRLEDKCSKPIVEDRHVYDTIVDDSVRRIIQ